MVILSQLLEYIA